MPPSSSSSAAAALLLLLCSQRINRVGVVCFGSACKARVSERSLPTPPPPPTPAPSAHDNQRIASIFNPTVAAGDSRTHERQKRTGKRKISARNKKEQLQTNEQTKERENERTNKHKNGRTKERKNIRTERNTPSISHPLEESSSGGSDRIRFTCDARKDHRLQIPASMHLSY